VNFDSVIHQLEHQLSLPLPGEPAQLMMAPYQRASREEALKGNPSPKLSAVLALIYPVQGKAFTTLMLRNSYKGVHSAQVSFPGGKMENSDTDLQHTALREAEEELAIPQTEVNVMGQLTEVYIPPSGFLVTPYVGYLNERPDFLPNEHEVQEIIETPLSMLMDDAIIKNATIPVLNGKMTIKAPYFDIRGKMVWGATAMMLSELKSLLAS